MGYYRNTEFNKNQRNPEPNTRVNKSSDSSGIMDLIRWIFIVPFVWLLIFACSAVSVMGGAPSYQIDLLSRKQADYSPWIYAVLQPFQKGLLEEIKSDYSLSDQTLTIFTQPSVASDPFVEETEISVMGTPIAATSTSIISSLMGTATATQTTGTDTSYSPTPSETQDPNASSTPSPSSSNTGAPTSTSTSTPSMTPSPSPSPSPSPTASPSSTIPPNPNPTSEPTQPINICGNYDYFHVHTPSYSDNIFGIIVHAMPIAGPGTEVVLTGVTVNQGGGNPAILTVNRLNWYHTGMGSTSVNVGQRSESVYVPTNLAFYACYPAGQCDHAYYGGFLEAEFDDTLNGGYELIITVHFPEYGKTCTSVKSITTN